MRNQADMTEVLAMLLAAAIFAGLVMFIALFRAIVFWVVWNHLVAAAFAVPKLSVLQAWGLLFVVGMLFGRSSGGSVESRAEKK